MIKPLVVVAGSILSAILYRMGGSSAWNKKWRDLGVPACAVLTTAVLFDGFSWWDVLHFGLLFAALTTYFDVITGEDNFFLHGLACGVAAFPIVIPCGNWWAFALRAVVLSLLCGIWSAWIKNAVWEESGRGALIIATLPILLL